MSRLKEVLAFVNNKGGCAKTTSAICLASAILRKQQKDRILVIDLDSQCNASMLLGWKADNTGQTVFDALSNHAPLPIYETTARNYGKGGGVFLCPGHKFMSGIDTALRLQRPAEKVLLKCFANEIANNTSFDDMPTDIAEAFDYIIIDCPPALGDITFNAMMASDSIIIPVQAERLSIDALSKSISAFKECQMDMHPDLKFRGILLTMLDERTSATKEFVRYITDTYGDAVFKTKIRRCTKLIEAQGANEDLYNYAMYCNTASDYEKLADELINNPINTED